MIKMIGLIMIIGSTSAAGLFINKNLKSREKLLRGFISSFEIIKSEIVFRSMPISQIVSALGSQGGGAANVFYKNAYKEMTSTGSTFFKCCKNWLPTLKYGGATPLDIEIIENGLKIVGRYDSETQGDLISRTIMSLEDQLKNAVSDLNQKGKLYKAMGVTVGIMLALIVV